MCPSGVGLIERQATSDKDTWQTKNPGFSALLLSYFTLFAGKKRACVQAKQYVWSLEPEGLSAPAHLPGGAIPCLRLGARTFVTQGIH